MIKKIIRLIIIFIVSFLAFSCTAQAVKEYTTKAQAVDVIEPYNYQYDLTHELTIQVSNNNNRSIYDYLVTIRVTSTRVTVRANGVKSDGTTILRTALFNDTTFSGLYSSIEAVYWDTLDYIAQDGTFLSTGGYLSVFSGRIQPQGLPDSERITPNTVGTLVCESDIINGKKYMLIKLYRNEGESEDETNVPMWILGIEIPVETMDFYIWKNRLTYDEGLADGIQQGYDEGFNDGSLNLNTAQAFWVGAQNFLNTIGDVVGGIFNKEIIPTSGISIGHIVLGVPLLFGALSLIFRFFKGEGEK